MPSKTKRQPTPRRRAPASTKPRRQRRELPAELAARKVRARLELAALRHAEKQFKAALANYKAADRGRNNKDWRAPTGSADLMVLGDADVLNARARQTVRDSWIGASMVRAAKRNVAGTGIDVVPTAKGGDGDTLLAGLNRRTRAMFWRWASKKTSCDVERRQSFWQKQRLCVSERYTVGQAFIVWSYESPTRGADGKVDKRQPVGLRLQSFEAEQLNTWIQSYTDEVTGEIHQVRNGIELEPKTQAAVAYHFWTRNPNDYLARERYKSVRVEAARVFHYFDQERVLQSQGVTQFAPVLQEVRDFNRFKEATLWRAIMEACIGFIVKKSALTPTAYSPIKVVPAAGDTGTTTTGMSTMDFVPGMVPHLNEGEDVVPFTPSAPGNQYDPFTTIQLRGIGAGAGMSYDQVTRHSDANYSAARQNMLEDWREWEIEQDNLVSDIILPVYVLFFNLAVLEGRFDDDPEFDDAEFLADPERFTDAACVAPARPWIDPEKEANGYKVLIDYRIITREEIMAGRGKRFAEQVRKMGEERIEAEDEGIVFPEDVDQQLKVAEANQKNADGDLKEAQAEVAKNPPPPPPPPAATPDTTDQQAAAMAAAVEKLDQIQRRRRQLAQGDAPNYRMAAGNEPPNCAGCRYFDAATSRCKAYDFIAAPDHVCDAFETPPIMDGTARATQAPGVPDGQPPMDDTRSPFLDRGARGVLATGDTYSLSSVQIDIPEPLRSTVLRFNQHLIPDAALAGAAYVGHGRETEPHITTLFGIKNPAPGPVKAIAADVAPFNVTLGRTGSFAGTDHDVVWVAVDSSDLVRLHNLLSKLSNIQTFASYNPHLTLAYVAAGQGQNYAGRGDLAGRSFRVDRLTFSAADGKRFEIQLTGTKTRLAESSSDLPAVTADAQNKTMLLHPAEGESRDAFIERFMGDAGMVAEYPEEAQRRAVAESYWSRTNWRSE